MANREQYGASPKRPLQRSDQALLLRERQTDATVRDDLEFQFEELQADLEKIIQRHFPQERSAFSPPSLERILTNLSFLANLHEEREQKEAQFSDRAFLAGAAIRYVDNFIDEALWPSFERMFRESGDVRGVESRFYAFLDAAYALARQYDPYLPPEIIDLPKIEFHLLGHPDQGTFDREIERYFFAKSFNVAYIGHLLVADRSAESMLWSDEERRRFDLMTAWDVARDLSNWEGKTDFDVFRHIHTYRLNPEKMIDLLWNILKENSKKVFDTAREVIRLPYMGEWYRIRQAIDEEGFSSLEAKAIEDTCAMISYLPRIHEPIEEEL